MYVRVTRCLDSLALVESSEAWSVEQAFALRLGCGSYDSYHVDAAEWARVLTPGGEKSLRGTASDGFFIGLWLTAHSGRELLAGITWALRGGL